MITYDVDIEGTCKALRKTFAGKPNNMGQLLHEGYKETTSKSKQKNDKI